MTKLTIYEKPSCTTCRKLSALLAEHDVECESIDYHVSGISEEELIAQIVASPTLLQRPIVVNGERALLARPIERALELL
jgi:arsenate reductase